MPFNIFKCLSCLEKNYCQKCSNKLIKYLIKYAKVKYEFNFKK